MISKNRKKIIVVSWVLFSALLLVCNFHFGTFQPILMDRIDSSHSNLNDLPEAIKFKGSGFWNLTGDPIFINGDATGIGAHNWTWAAKQDWCNGSGTLNDPYIIENITLNAKGSGSGIEIENSSVYFIIRNCTIKNSGNKPFDAGIKLYNVKNGILFNNTCSYNKRMGLSLQYSKNCSILNNTLINNYYYGISLSFSNNNTISGNSVISGLNGIYLTDSNNNIVSKNVLNRNNKGLHITTSNNNTFMGNTLNSSYEGIFVIYSNNNTFLKNLMNKCGVYFSDSLEVTASQIIDPSNKVNGKPIYYYANEVGLGSNNFTNAGQIILINCSDSLISNLNISYSSYGISLYYCKNITIINNNISHNIYGVFLSYSNENTISGNIANHNVQYGIVLSYSHKNDIISNHFFNNTYAGIEIWCSNNNFISKNTVNYNYFFGIYLNYGYYNRISKNNASYNLQYGILLVCSYKNDIISNNASNNNYEGITLVLSNNNFISKNTINFNQLSGIKLIHSNENTILENTANNNIQYGIYLNQSNYNYIIGNILIDNQEAIKEENCLLNFFEYLYPDNDDGEQKESIPNPFIFFTVLIFLVCLMSGLAISSHYLYNRRSKSKQKNLGENRFNKPAHLYDIELTLLPEDFLAKIEQLEWDKGEKERFLKEMLSLSIDEREEYLEEMLKESIKNKNFN